MHFLEGQHDVLELVKEPLVDLCELVDAVNGVSGPHCLGYHEYTGVGRLAESCLYVGNLEFLVAYESVGSLADHPQTLLDGFLEAAAYGHDLSDRFHGGTDLARDTVELAEVPARDLADNIVKRGLEEGRGCLGD